MTDISSEHITPPVSEEIKTPDELVKQNKAKLEFLLKNERQRLLDSLESAFAFGLDPNFSGEPKLLNEAEFNKQRNSEADTYDIAVEVGVSIVGAIHDKFRPTGVLSLRSRSTLGEVVCNPEYTVALTAVFGKEREVVASVEAASFDASKIAVSLEGQCNARQVDKLYYRGSSVPIKVVQNDSFVNDIDDRLERRLSDQYRRLYEDIIPAIASVIAKDSHFGFNPELDYGKKSEHAFTDTHPEYTQGFAALNTRIDILGFNESADEIGQREKFARGWVNVVQHDYEDPAGSCGSLYTLAVRIIDPEKDKAESLPEITIKPDESGRSIKKKLKSALNKVPSP